MIQQFHFWVFTWKTKTKTLIQKDVHPDVHGCTIYENQNTEVTKCSLINDWVKTMWDICLSICLCVSIYYIDIMGT